MEMKSVSQFLSCCHQPVVFVIRTQGKESESDEENPTRKLNLENLSISREEATTTRSLLDNNSQKNTVHEISLFYLPLPPHLLRQSYLLFTAH